MTEDNFNRLHLSQGNLKVLSLGIGALKDHSLLKVALKLAYKMFDVICDALISGTVNLVDAARNFRYRKSERVTGVVIPYLMKEKYIQREEMVLAPTRGFIVKDADLGLTHSQKVKDLLASNVINSESDVYQLNCIEPAFIDLRLEQSVNRTAVKTLDFY